MKNSFVGFCLCLCIYSSVYSMELVRVKDSSVLSTIDQVISQATSNHVLAFDCYARSFTISDCAIFAEKIKKIPSLEKLEKVVFACLCHVDCDGVRKLTEALHQHTSVYELDFSFNPAFSHDELRCLILSSLLMAMRYVSVFKFKSNDLAHITEGGLRSLTYALGQMQIEELDLSFNHLNQMQNHNCFSSLMGTLSALSQLKTLRLRDNGLFGFNAGQWYALCGMISSATRLKTLDLSANGLGLPVGMPYWSVFLNSLTCSSIEELNVSDNWFDALDGDAWDSFTATIACMKKFKRLVVCGSGLSVLSKDRQWALIKALQLHPGAELVMTKRETLDKNWIGLAAEQNPRVIIEE